MKNSASAIKLSIHEKQYQYCPTCKTKLKRKLIDGRARFFCPACNFIFWDNPKPVVSILLHDGKKVLMLQRANEPLKGYWCLPGGYIDYGETPREAIIRETKEEVSIKLTEVGRLIGVYRIDNDPRGVNIDIIYEGEMKSKAMNLSEEHGKYKFFSAKSLPKKIAYKHREAIEDWLSQRKGVKIKI